MHKSKLRETINKAIDKGSITLQEYDEIIQISLDDGHIDKYERALLGVLSDMVNNREIKFTK